MSRPGHPDPDPDPRPDPRPDPGRPPITPQTKVGELLERYPQLEEVLLGLSPHFAALRNPVLRKTVARVATLSQVAKVGNLPLGDLVRTLREAAGAPEDDFSSADRAGGNGPSDVPTVELPTWAGPDAVVTVYDARNDLDRGTVPASKVMKDLSGLGAGEVYVLVTPFVPEPLREMAEKNGFEAVSVREEREMVRTYFRRV